MNFKTINPLRFLRLANIRRVAANEGAFAAWTKRGRLAAWGDGPRGGSIPSSVTRQLGRPATNGAAEDVDPVVGVVAATTAFAALGRALTNSARGNGAASSLFSDFVLPPLAALITRAPAKRHAALRIAHAFVPLSSEAHVGFIKELQESMGQKEMPSFVHALTILIFMETAMDDVLLDLYLYYCVMGLSMPSPSLRASSVAMLSVVAQHKIELVLDMLPRLAVMAEEESWWEIRFLT